MWVRFLQKHHDTPQNGVVWTDDNDAAQSLIDDGLAARVLGPDGVSIEEAAPEDAIEQMAREENKTFADKEEELTTVREFFPQSKKSFLTEADTVVIEDIKATEASEVAGVSSSSGPVVDGEIIS